MNTLTVHELRLRQAELAHRAECLRQEWRRLPSLSNRALMLGRQVKDYQQRADDYARLIEMTEAS